MGVTGLWRLIEPAGKPVPVETLENKVLAVDISIWLHQIVKGYQDAKGAPIPNAHLIGLFQRLCKLLYFRIKPVFVFDGGFPDLKKDTIGKRQANKAKYNSESERLKRELSIILGKKSAIGTLLGKNLPTKKTNAVENSDDLFILPALPEKDQESEPESEDEKSSSASSIDLHTVDLESEKFKNLPAKEKYDLLVELKETRKMNSWGKLHTLPKKSDNFSDFQMQRLLKRRKVQECLEETEKEIGEGSMSLNELESLLNEEGIDTKIESLPSRRIASSDKTRFLLISSVKEALAEAKKKDANKTVVVPQNDSNEINIDSKESSVKNNELEDDLQKAIKMSLECVDDDHNAFANTSKTDESWTSNFTESDYSDSEDEDGFVQSDISSAKAYIMQYSDFTNKAIDAIVTSKEKRKKNHICFNVDNVIEELNNEKSIIEEQIDLSSSEDDCIKCVSISKECSVIDLKTDIVSKNVRNVDTEASVIYVEQNNDDVVALNSSTEDDFSEELNINVENEKSYNELYNKSNKIKDESISDNISESSEDEFEEVTENDKFKVPVVQLTLNVNEKQELEDDIFADIFDKNIVDSAARLEQGKALYNNTLSGEITMVNTLKESLQENIPVTIMPDRNIAAKLQQSVDTNQSCKKPQISVNSVEIPKATLKYNQMSITLDTKQEGSLVPEKPKLDRVDLDDIHLSPKNIPVTAPEKNITLKPLECPDANKSEIEQRIPFDSNNEIQSSIFKDKLNMISMDIEEQERNIVQEKSKLDRIGRNITEQITKEAQELLQIFGIPYIIAPMEAEAQCAFLESVKLTDGTITDDSDIWLFGGQTVYKNFFNQKKHVLQYLSERIEKAFNLTREQLILLALLVGSDYTTGINGVGPVTALEILASFPFNKKNLLIEQSKQAKYNEIVAGLINFKKWVKAGKRTDNISLKKKLKNVNLTDDFPSVRVVQAYLEPDIDKSEDKLTWGNIDVTILRDYTKTKFGWSQNKLDEIIKPVLKRIQDHKNQKTVFDYFKKKTDFKSLEDLMSKRVKAAVQKMGPHESDANNEKDNKKILKRKISATKTNNKTTCELAKSTVTDVPSTSKRRKDADIDMIPQVVKTHELLDKDKKISIDIIKSQTLQEIIPQREKDKQSMLQNKLKAIEMFRKTKIDRKTKTTKRKLPKPKEDAELSESSDSN